MAFARKNEEYNDQHIFLVADFAFRRLTRTCTCPGGCDSLDITNDLFARCIFITIISRKKKQQK